MRGHLPRFVLPLAALLLACPALAQWAPNGVRLSGGLSGTGNLIVSDGIGGAFVWWQRSANSGDVSLQHVSAAGFIVEGWPATGLPLAASLDPEGIMDVEPDGQGGVFVIWYRAFYDQDFNVEVDNIVQRIQADGTPAPGWPPGGLRLFAPRHQNPAALAADGAGGVFIVWEDDRNDPIFATRNIYALHLQPDGTLAPGWPADGLPVATGPFDISSPKIVPDGQGGAYMFWNDTRRGTPEEWEPFGIRVHGDGTLASGWQPNGMLIGTEWILQACSDGAGGAYALTSAWDHVQLLELRYYLRRIAPDGSTAPGWPAEGVVVCDAEDFRAWAQLASDGRDGALVAWSDSRGGGAKIYLIRILPDGSLAPGWTEDGTRISDPMNGRYEYAPRVAADGAGGAFVTWDLNGPAAVHHLTATGQPAPGWPAFGLPVATSSSQRDPKITSDGVGGAIVAWNEGCCGRNGIWAQRYVADGIVAVQLSLVSAVAETDRVSLEWFAAEGSGLAATVERRREQGGWLSLASITADGTGHLRFEDRDVTPGERYAYRLSYRDGELDRVTAETWVEIPAAFELALAGFVPNPAVGTPEVSFTLPRSGPGRIELFDLAGRRVAEQPLAGLPAGRHLIRLAPETELPPAAYVMRLSFGARTLTGLGVVVR